MTGKLTHTYLDEHFSGEIVDYMGVPGKYEELSSVHLKDADYNLSLSRELSDYLLSIQDFV